MNWAFKFTILLLLINSTPTLGATSDCIRWFDKLKIKIGSSDCELSCMSAIVDMGTFSCHEECSELCKGKEECKLPDFWSRALKSDPKPFKNLIGEEQEKAGRALSRLPKAFQPKSLSAVVKAAAKYPFAPDNPASSGPNLLILFPVAFEKKSPLERILVHEVAHFLVRSEWKDVFEKYRRENGWANKKEGESRPGDFVASDGRDSADEDFANNIEYYIFEPQTLRSRSPNIYSWLAKHLGKDLVLKKGCK